MAQTAETKPAEKSYTLTKSQFDKYVADAVAADRAGRDKPASDEQVLNPQNWHKAIFNKMEFVIYTGPGQAMMHHWVPDTTRPSAAKGGAATSKGN